MAISPDYAEFIKELMAPLGPVTIRRMFGGAGVFADGLMFALIAGDVLHFKADGQNRPMFEAEDMPPFVYETKDGRRAVMSYMQAPEHLFDDPDEFAAWAREALSAALRADAAKPKKKAQPKAKTKRKARSK